MEIRIINHIDDFILLEESWNNLFDLRKSSIFQSFYFNYSSWKYLISKDKSRKLSILTIYQNQILIGIFPFYIDRRLIRFINDKHADFCDILLVENVVLDLSKILQKIIKKYNVKSLQLINLKENSLFFQQINSNFKFQRRYITTQYSFIKLQRGNFPNNSKNLLSKQKYEIKKILKKTNAQHQILSNYNKDKFPLFEIQNLRDTMISNELRGKDFLDNDFLFLLERMFLKDLIDISIVKNHLDALAISFIAKNDNDFMFWVDIFDNTKRINLYNYSRYMMSLSKNSVIEMNFGRGLYKYKMINFHPDIADLFALDIFFNRFSFSSYRIKDFLFSCTKRLYKRIKK